MTKMTPPRQQQHPINENMRRITFAAANLQAVVSKYSSSSRSGKWLSKRDPHYNDAMDALYRVARELEEEACAMTSKSWRSYKED